MSQAEETVVEISGHTREFGVFEEIERLSGVRINQGAGSRWKLSGGLGPNHTEPCKPWAGGLMFDSGFSKEPLAGFQLEIDRLWYDNICLIQDSTYDVIYYDVTHADTVAVGYWMDRHGLGLETQRPVRRFIIEERVQWQVRENTSEISLSK